MAGQFRILTAALLVAHFTVGCCAHHAHACDGMDRPLPAQGAATPDGQCPGSGVDHAHHGPHDCQGGKCSVVSPNRTVRDGFVPPFQTFSAPLLDDLPALVGNAAEQRFFPTGRLLLPVRLHLANQVLLI